MPVIRCLLLCLLIGLQLSACSRVLTATREGPITEDPSDRTLGSFIDDQLIETKLAVNLSKGSDALDNAPIDANSYNGIVLLTGQIPSEALKVEAGDIAGKLRKVRKVHNELTVAPPIGFLASTSDAWISTKVKTKMSFDTALKSSKIRVITENGVVYLMGLVSQPESQRAAKIASETRGVQRVVRVFEYY